MDDTDLGETTLLISSIGLSPPVQDNRSRRQRQLAIYLILASTLFERLAFYSLALNLVVTLKSAESNWDPENSTTASFIFFGVSYLSTLIFAAVSDARLGRERTIVVGFILYIIGYIFINLIANVNTHDSICKGPSPTHVGIFTEHCGPQIVGTLIFMAIGVGAVQANMAVFGAEQTQESKITSRYFDKYYIAVNIGAIAATLSVPLVQTDTENMTASNSYFFGYLIAMFMLLISAGLFIFGRRYYLHVPPYDSVIMKCIPVVLNAFQNWLKHENARERSASSSRRRDSGQGRNSISEDETLAANSQSLSFLDYAKAANRGKFTDRIVNDVKSLRRAFIVFILLIPYWIIYYQIQITFPLQGQHMSIPILRQTDPMPISWMSLGDSVAIIVGLMIFNLFVYKRLSNPSRTLSIRRKLVIGMILASLSMCIAGIVEIFRQNQCISDKDDSSLSIFAQLPQNICMGLAEIFATVASLEYAYLAAPRSAQALLMSLQFCSLGISSVIGKAYLSLYSTTTGIFDFSCQHLNQWTFTLYFFVLAALQIPLLIIIVICDRKFQILKLNPQQIDNEQFQSR
ncbi:unnamed protein product [Adineta ricciae]|uniref:Uncharacterized protein n=1 Tax=Adineta ricciae TaxID=249248 RepID=A0A813YVA1_ADIRI|nr:unnamed protein product [Adineta ricciae]CAF0889637.1 unnamed protein product [Adineta ricciae]